MILSSILKNIVGFLVQFTSLWHTYCMKKMLGVLSSSSNDCSYDDVVGFTNQIKSKTNIRPTIGIVCGSGLGGLALAAEDTVTIPYTDISGFPVSTVKGHKGQFVLGTLNGKSVIFMQGRFHLYEGYSSTQVGLPIRVMCSLGIKTLIVSNASGGINRSYNVGDIMIMRDHIFMPGFAGDSPLRGLNDERFGPRFVNMADAYNKDLRLLALKTAKTLGFENFVRDGVYVMVAGPQYETPAELRFFQFGGADVVGMSTAPEVIVARHHGVKCLGISLVTNKCILDNNQESETNHEEVLETGKLRSQDVLTLVSSIVEKL